MSSDQEDLTPFETRRIKAFVAAQVFFAFGSLLAGGLRGRPWSLLDTAILLLSIGLTGLAFVLETRNGRRRVMRVAATFYLFGVIDMAFNILASGVLGLKPILAAMAQ
ncbi:MAG: hypothetical protein ACPG31_01585 [Planctomycetota bacterium]